MPPATTRWTKNTRWLTRSCRKLSGLVFSAATAAAATVTLNEGPSLQFGDRLADVEARLQERAFDAERGRSGVDRMIALTTAALNFDTDRLWRVTLKSEYVFPQPLTPFADGWKNFTPIE